MMTSPRAYLCAHSSTVRSFDRLCYRYRTYVFFVAIWGRCNMSPAAANASQQADYQYELVSAAKDAPAHSDRVPGSEPCDRPTRECLAPTSVISQGKHKVRVTCGPDAFGYTADSEHVVD